MERFDSVGDSEIKFFIESSTCDNTKKSTNNWIHVYQVWARSRGKEENLEKLEPGDLNKVLEQFYAEVKTVKGKDYEPDSLKVMLAALDRYLKEKQYPISIRSGREFSTSKQVLEGKARELRKQGLGKRPNRAHSLTGVEEDLLWNVGKFSIREPRALLRTVWWTITQHFGLRGREQHYRLNVEDLLLLHDDEGRKYYVLKNGPEKNHQGGLNCNHRLVQPKMFETRTKRCPVNILSSYLSKRPKILKSSGPLYLAVIDKPKSPSVWYKTNRLGVHSLNNMMKDIVSGTSIASTEKKLTNHSARKTCVRKLKSAGFAKSEIKNITGHSRADGLDPYDSGNETEMRQMSNAIVPRSCPQNLQQSSSITSPALSEKFSMGIPWGDSVPSITQGNTYIFQNCQTVNIQAAEKISNSPPPRKRRVILPSSEDSQSQ